MNQYVLLPAIFIIVVAIKFIINYLRRQDAIRLTKCYSTYVAEPSFGFHQHIPEIKEIFKVAGVDNHSLYIQEPAGLGMMGGYYMDPMSNIARMHPHIISTIYSYFAQSIGVFELKMKEAYSPRYWLELVVKLPEHLLKAMGVLPEAIVVKMLNAIWWLASTFFALYKANCLEWLMK